MASWDITLPNSALEFDTVQGVRPSYIFEIDSTHYVFGYSGSGSDGYIQVVGVNTSTWAITATTSYEHDTVSGLYHAMQQVDSTHYLIFYQSGSAIEAQVIEVDASTYAISAGSVLTVQSAASDNLLLEKIDSTHYLAIWRDMASNVRFINAQVLEVDTSTNAVTTAGSVYAGSDITNNYSSAKVDSNHVLLNYQYTTDTTGRGQVFEVNISTWAVTTVGSAYSHASIAGTIQNTSTIATASGNFICFYRKSTGTEGYAIALNVDGSYNVTAPDSEITVDATSMSPFPQSSTLIDSTHVLLAYTGVDADGFAKIVEINNSTGALSVVGTQIEYDTVQSSSQSVSSPLTGNTDKVLVAYQGSGSDGYIVVLDVEVPAGGGSTGQIKAKISGTMTAKPIKAKISGTFTTKPVKYKTGGTFTETGY